MAGLVTRKKYSNTEMEIMKTMLENYAEKGEPRYYEIFVDNMKVVGKTNDVNDFDNYQSFVVDATETVKVLLFTASKKSAYNDKFIYDVKNKDTEKQHGLSGVELDNRIQEIIKTEQERYEKKDLQNTLDATKKELDEALEYIEQLEQKVDEFNQNKNTLKGVNLGEVVGLGLEALIRNNVPFIEKYAGVKGLAGALREDNKRLESETTDTKNDSEVSFTPAENSTSLSDEEKNFLIFMNQLQGRLEESEVADVLSIIGALVEQPSQIATIKDLLITQKENNDGQI